MSEFSTQVQRMLTQYVNPKIEILAAKIASIEAYTYDSKYLHNLSDELGYINTLNEFLVEYVDNEEEMSDETRRIVTRLAMQVYTAASLVDIPKTTGLYTIEGSGFILYKNNVIQSPTEMNELTVGEIYDFILLSKDRSLDKTGIILDDIGILEDGNRAYIENYYMRSTIETVKTIIAKGTRQDGSVLEQVFSFNILT